jgi:hypothetical protein
MKLQNFKPHYQVIYGLTNCTLSNEVILSLLVYSTRALRALEHYETTRDIISFVKKISIR